MSQGPLCPNLSQKVQKQVSQMANRNLPIAMLLGGLSVNLNHLKRMSIDYPMELPNKKRTMLKMSAHPEPLKNRKWRVFAWRVSGKEN